jgi:hypothetical protein
MGRRFEQLLPACPRPKRREITKWHQRLTHHSTGQQNTVLLAVASPPWLRPITSNVRPPPWILLCCFGPLFCVVWARYLQQCCLSNHIAIKEKQSISRARSRGVLRSRRHAAVPPLCRRSKVIFRVAICSIDSAF